MKRERAKHYLELAVEAATRQEVTWFSVSEFSTLSWIWELWLPSHIHFPLGVPAQQPG